MQDPRHSSLSVAVIYCDNSDCIHSPFGTIQGGDGNAGKDDDDGVGVRDVENDHNNDYYVNNSHNKNADISNSNYGSQMQ